MATPSTTANDTDSAAKAGRPNASAASRPTPASAAYPASLGLADVVRRTSPPGRRHRDRLEQVKHDVVGAHLLHPELGLQREPVRERGHGDRLHVLGGDEVPARSAAECVRA